VNYEIVELSDLSGNYTTIYSIIKDVDTKSLFEHFVEENIDDHREEVISILHRLKVIGETTGAREGFFKHNEGKPGDLVCALYDEPDKNLRLYCIRYGSVAIILGGGGMKEVRAWQHDPKLSKEVNAMIKVSEDIFQRMKEGDLRWSPDGKKLIGNLNFSEDEEED
jgi:hypothetical protein